MNHQKKLSTTDQNMMTVTADRDLFGRLLVIANAREIHMKEILAYELSSVPFFF